MRLEMIPKAPPAFEEAPPRRALPFRNTFETWVRKLDEGEKLVSEVGRRGGDYSPSELLALQVGIYRYAEMVDLSAKVVERAASTVKTLLQAQ